MELTEILVAVKQPDLQKNIAFSESVHESPRNGKSFSELLAGISSENQSSEVEKYSRESEKTKIQKDENVSSVKDSEKENSTDKIRNSDQDKVNEYGKTEKKDSVHESEEKENAPKPENLVYSVLNLVKEENQNATNPDQKSEKVSSIGDISNNLLDKIASQDDEERISLLSQGKKTVSVEDFDFEIVSDEALALESAQNKSVENPEDFLFELSKGQNSELSAGKEKTDSNLKLKEKISVTDLRIEKPQSENTVKDNAEPKMKVTMTGNDSATIEMNLQSAQSQTNSNVLSANAQVSASDGSTFQAMLNNQIQANASEIVQTGNIVLKDNNKGTINLVLHPDDIGSVKMTLSLDGDKITGHIVVNTKEALEVFKNNAESLREAFVKNGYENASFEVSYNNSGNSSGQQFAEQNQHEQNMFFARREYGSLSQETSDFDYSNYSEEYSEISKNGINIVA